MSEKQTTVNGILRVCCARDLRVVEARPGGLTVRQCATCGRKHYSMSAEGFRIDMRAAMLGAKGEK